MGLEDFLISRSVILLPAGNRIFRFTNNRGSFLKTIKMTVKGAKMCAIVDPKCNPKSHMVKDTFVRFVPSSVFLRPPYCLVLAQKQISVPESY